MSQSAPVEILLHIARVLLDRRHVRQDHLAICRSLAPDLEALRAFKSSNCLLNRWFWCVLGFRNRAFNGLLQLLGVKFNMASVSKELRFTRDGFLQALEL